MKARSFVRPGLFFCSGASMTAEWIPAIRAFGGHIPPLQKRLFHFTPINLRCPRWN